MSYIVASGCRFSEVAGNGSAANRRSAAELKNSETITCLVYSAPAARLPELDSMEVPAIEPDTSIMLKHFDRHTFSGCTVGGKATNRK